MEENIMENNEIMELEEMEVFDCEVVEGEKTGMSTGGAVLLGAALTAAGFAVVKLIKKGWAKYKAYKEVRHPDKETFVSDEDIEGVTE
jgi:hypothetical protein